MENIVDIYNLLPEEISEAIEKLTDALEIVKKRKNTNSKFVDKIKDKNECPHCKSYRIVKNGHDKIHSFHFVQGTHRNENLELNLFS